MAQDPWTLQEKEAVKTGARAATAGLCCSCQRDSPYNLRLRRSWRTWTEQWGGQSKLERGQTMRRAVGMAWQRQAGKQGRCRRTQPADGLPSTSLVANSQQLAGLAAKQQPQTTLAGLSPCSGGSAVVLATQKAGSDLPYGLPPNLSPLPVSFYTHSLNL